MIISKCFGGLGNQLFQYATGRRIAMLHNTKLFLDTTHYANYSHRNFGLSYFNTDFTEINNYKVFALKHPSHFLKMQLGYVPVIREKFEQSQNIDTFPGNCILEGYWANENYFVDIRDVLLNEMQIKQTFKSTGFNYYQNVISGTNAISVHIRRGDYLKPENKSIFQSLNVEYYKEAMNIIYSKVTDPIFYFFSDDMKWVKANFPKQTNYFYVNEDNILKDFEELILMSLCQHNIIANSTFSWWGGWLNGNPGKVIIQTSQWYSDATYQALFENNQALYAENFTRI